MSHIGDSLVITNVSLSNCPQSRHDYEPAKRASVVYYSVTPRNTPSLTSLLSLTRLSLHSVETVAEVPPPGRVESVEVEWIPRTPSP
jgi:hypothetical protein